MTSEAELIAEKFRGCTEAELDAEEVRLERARRVAVRRQDLDRYHRRLVALAAERMRRVAPAPSPLGRS